MTEHELRKFIFTKRIGNKINVFDTLDSTNTYAKSLAASDMIEGTVIIADEQHSGRGRHGRTWISSKGLNLTFSIILKPIIPIEQLGVVSLLAGLAVCEAISMTTTTLPTCKWPNDVIIDAKKCAGILCETVFEGGTLSSLIVGIGVNVNQCDFPTDLRMAATSMAKESGSILNRYEVLGKILDRFEFWYDRAQAGDIPEVIQTWKTKSATVGKDIIVDQHGKLLRGTAEGIADDGGLILRTSAGLIKILAGEVTVIH